MILENLLPILQDGQLFQIKPSLHERTWGYYFKQYHKAFCLLLEVSKKKAYKTNRKFMPFMFLIRHSVELFLKKKCERKAIPLEFYIKTHNVKNLFKLLNLQDDNFLMVFASLRCDSEGDCWRYHIDKDGRSYFQPAELIDVYNACRHYCILTQNDDPLAKFENDKRFRYELTFHTSEIRTLGQIATQYDFAIIEILHAIVDGHSSIGEVYLPLFFLIRHSLELKLKQAIQTLDKIIGEQNPKDLYDCHSVEKLYNMLSIHTDKAIEIIINDKLKEESERFRNIVVKYKDLIQNIDANSSIFRFPKDNKGNNSGYLPKKKDVYNVLQLYQQSDPFLCFVIDVLCNEGVLK